MTGTAVTKEDIAVEIKTILGERSNLFPDKKILAMSKEIFQSITFQAAGYHSFPSAAHGKGDRFLYIVNYEDGCQLIISAGKIYSGNPREASAMLEREMDLGKLPSTIHLYDGGSTIDELMLPDSDTKKYEGEFGKPDVLLRILRASLGTCVEKKDYL